MPSSDIFAFVLSHNFCVVSVLIQSGSVQATFVFLHLNSALLKVLSFLLFWHRYHWIKRIGKPAPRDVAPIVVSNHVSYIEPIFFFYELFPTIVASESHDSIPFVGTIIRAMQVFSIKNCFLSHISFNIKVIWLIRNLKLFILLCVGYICW